MKALLHIIRAIFFSVLILAFPSAYGASMCNTSSSTDATGTLTDSGGSGGKYSNNESCDFLIQPSGAGTISLTFSAFQLESGYDFLTIYDGATDSAPKLANKLTGNSTPASVTSSGGTMLVRFTSDSSKIRHGFVANWTSTTGDDDGAAAICVSSSSINATGTLTDSGGSGGKYSNNESCDFLIQPNDVSSITLTFSAFALENARFPFIYDYLTIYDGPTDASTKLANNLEGDSIPASVTSSGGSMLVRFHSDFSETRDGFVANWTSTTGDDEGAAVPPAQYCAAPFVNAATSSGTNGEISYEGSPIIYNDSSGVLAAKTLEAQDIHSSLTCDGFGGCSVSGLATTPLVLGSFLESSDKVTVLNIASNVTLGSSGDNNFGVINLTDNGTLNFSANFTQYFIEELNVLDSESGSATINLAPGSYYIGEFESNANTTINIVGTGAVRIFFRDHSDFEGNTRVNENGDPQNILIYAYDEVHLKDTTELVGFVYSQNEVGLRDSVSLTGAISADILVELEDNAEIYYDCGGATLTDHFEINHDGQGLACEAESITIKACADVSCLTLNNDATDVQLSINGSVDKTVTVSGGSTSTSFSYTNVGTATLSLGQSFACKNGASTSCDVIFSDAGFKFLYGAAESTTVGNQVSGTNFTDIVKLQAVKNVGGVCTDLFTGNVDVALSQQNIEPAGTTGLNFNVNSNPIAKYPSYTSNITLDFGDDSKAVIPTPVYLDAGQIRLHADYNVGGVALSGSSNSFWVSPAELVISAKSGSTTLNSVTATSTPTHKAGEDFNLTVTAYNAATPAVVTPNYLPGQIQFKLARTGPTLAESVDGNLTYADASILGTIAINSPDLEFKPVTLDSFSSGVSTYTGAKYSEVGLLNLDIQDSNYGNASIVIPATAINIGRFTPDHFKQTVATDGSFLATCNTGSAFAYSGQKDEATDSVGAISYLTNPTLAITAYNKQGDVTKNYYQDSQGSVNDYMKLSASDVAVTTPIEDQVAIGVDTNKLMLTANMNGGNLSQNDLTALPATIALPNGVLHYQLSNDDNFFYNRSANALVGPFTSIIDFSTATVKDADDVDLIPSLGVATTVNASPTGVEIRFGRLLLKNSFGPETSNLPQHMQIEHFDATGFVVSSDNDCVSYDASNISLTNISLDPALTDVLGGTGNFIEGKTKVIELEALEAGNQGNIGVSYDTYDWLKFDWKVDGVYINPSATATFGLYRGNDRIIYMREVYN